MHEAYIDSTIEAMILASPEPLPGRKISQVLSDVTPSRVAQAVADLNTRYADGGTSFRIREIAGGYQYYILPEYVGYIEDLFARRRKLRLTRAALETLAITAYKQPVTKTDIEHIRGVASDGVLHNLLEKKLVAITGRAETVGKPLEYGTTNEFLKFFGLNALKDLPKMSEIEELIAASEPKSQTELRLDQSESGELPVKLNVADGTFDPEEREAADDTTGETMVISESESDSDVAESPLVEESESTETAVESEVAESPVGTLVLKKTTPETADDTTESEEADEDLEESEKVVPTNSENAVAAQTD